MTVGHKTVPLSGKFSQLLCTKPCFHNCCAQDVPFRGRILQLLGTKWPPSGACFHNCWAQNGPPQGHVFTTVGHKMAPSGACFHDFQMLVFNKLDQMLSEKLLGVYFKKKSIPINRAGDILLLWFSFNYACLVHNTHTPTFVLLLVCVHSCLQVCTHTHTCTHTHAHMHAHIMHMHQHAQTCTYSHTHSHTVTRHTCTQACTYMTQYTQSSTLSSANTSYYKHT